MRWILHAAASFVASFVGPCFQLRIETEVRVDESGSSTRQVLVESTDTGLVSLALPSSPAAPSKLIAYPLASFTADGPGPKGPPSARWSSSQRLDPGETARDLEIGRPSGGARATQRAQVLTEDYGVFRRVRYREQIRDSGSADSQIASAQKIAKSVSEVLRSAAQELLGNAYRLDELDGYLRGRGMTAFVELWRLASQLGESPRESVDGMLALAQREGFAIDGPKARALLEKTMSSEQELADLGRSLRDAALRKLASLLRRHGSTPEHPGSPVAAEELSFLHDAELVLGAFRRASERTLGSQNGLDQMLHAGGTDLYGCFGGAFLDPDLGDDSVQWRTTLSMPGMLLRTNGVPLQDGRVLWLLLSTDLSLRTTQFEAESIVLETNRIVSLGGRKTTADPEEILILLSELGAGKDRAPRRSLTDALRAAAEGDAEQRSRVLKDPSLELVRKIFEIPKQEK
ncbi:MAG: hypothetical protein JNJ88_02950 [Planctomycetes bacterium]|nr:hypothetical protein [Planctomycetota bacterium]